MRFGLRVRSDSKGIQSMGDKNSGAQNDQKNKHWRILQKI